MITKAMHKLMPPVNKRESEAPYEGGLIILYTHVIVGDVWTGMGKVCVRYSEDFCGGMEIRSAYVQASMTSDRGWDFSIPAFEAPRLLATPLGKGFTLAHSLENYSHYPHAGNFPENCNAEERKQYVKDLVYGALAARILSLANECTRNALIGRDRTAYNDGFDSEEDGAVVTLMHYIERMDGWCGWYSQGYGLRWHNRTEQYNFRRPFGRVMNTISFHNFNSNNAVGVFVLASPDSQDRNCIDAGWDDDFEGEGRTDFFITNSRDADIEHSDNIYNMMVSSTPKTGWCIG